VDWQEWRASPYHQDAGSAMSVTPVTP
jgi:hypothetical protein